MRCVFVQVTSATKVHLLMSTYTKKVKKGRWPGGRKFLIHSDRVLNGDATPRQVESLYRKEFGAAAEKRTPSRSRRASSGYPTQQSTSPRPEGHERRVARGRSGRV